MQNNIGFYNSYALVDLDSIKSNFNKIKKPICCVVKANAYGHGLIPLGKFFEKMGASYFAVANIQEAIKIRNHGIQTPILILGYTKPEFAKLLFDNNLSQCVYSLEYAIELDKHAREQNAFISIHIKIDTGMGRLGFRNYGPHNELEEAYKATCLPHLLSEGIFTHFCIADEGKNDYTRNQYLRFCEAISFIESRGIKFKIHHCSNSAASIEFPEFISDMTRAGIALYGYDPCPNDHGFLPAITLKSVVSHIKRVSKGDSISYGRSFIAPKELHIATISIGYADGIFRSNTGNYVIINGTKCPIIGNICMDQMMAIAPSNTKIGDEVIVYGGGIPISEVAKYNNTISYEVLCSIGERVPRFYKLNGNVFSERLLLEYLEEI